MATPKSPGRFGPTRYTYEELAEAAQHFSNKCLLEQGGFGQVYQGSLRGETFAIKKLAYFPDQQTKKELEHEIEVVSRVSHKNLVKLVGYCVDELNALLVLEYFPNKSLRVNLHEKSILDWPKRMTIAIGSARGLEYLHEYCHPKIIHQDIKPDNILLDNNFEPKIADFGLAVVFPDVVSHISRPKMGTEVYIDPEDPNKISDKSDVYAFGVVLLELITGRKSKYEKTDIVKWASTRIEHALEEKYEGFVDFKLKTYDEKEMKRMIYCAAACVYNFVKTRPSIRKIVRALEGDIDLANVWDKKNDNKLRRLTDNNNVDYLQHTTSTVWPPQTNTPMLRGSQAAAATFVPPASASVSPFTTSSATGIYGQAASYPVMGPNANPLDNSPQGFPQMRSGAAGARALDFFQNSPQFQALRARYGAEPHLWQLMLQDLWSQNPQIVSFIQENEADFVRFINEPVEGGEGNILGQQHPAMPQTRVVMPDEREAILYGQAAAPNMVVGQNFNPPHPFPQGVPHVGASTSGAGTRYFFRNSPEFQALKARLRADPHIFQPMLQDLWSQNPNIVRFIQENYAEFSQFINEP